MIIHLTYFKLNGKFYTSTDWEVPDGMLHHHVVSKLRGWATAASQNDPLPGLGGDGWEGYVVLQIGDVPHLLELERPREQPVEPPTSSDLVLDDADILKQLIHKRTGLSPQELQCPREKSQMTPCVARDGSSATTNCAWGVICVGCERTVKSLLHAERAHVSPPQDAGGLL